VLLIGPAFGGLTSEPMKQYPHFFREDDKASRSLFLKYPFIFPNLIGFLLALLAFCLILRQLPETLNGYGEQQPPISSSLAIEMTRRISPLPEYSRVDTEEREDGTKTSVSCDKTDESFSSETEDTLEMKEEESIQKTSSASSGISVEGRGKLSQLMRNRETMCSIVLYAGHSFTSICYGEVFPLWCVATTDCGGLGLSSKHVGVIMTLTGVFVITYQAVLFPLAIKRLEATQIMILMQLTSSVLLVGLPFLSHVIEVETSGTSTYGADVWLVIILASMWNSTVLMAFTSSFVCSNTFVNNSCEKETRGTANGLSMACGSVTKSIGPMVAAPLFAFSINSSPSRFMDYKISFVFLAFQSVAWATFTSLFIPVALNHRKSN
jgi:hypothetical protein